MDSQKVCVNNLPQNYSVNDNKDKLTFFTVFYLLLSNMIDISILLQVETLLQQTKSFHIFLDPVPSKVTFAG